MWSLFKYTEVLRKWGNLKSVSLEMYVIYFSIWEAHIDNSKSNNFDEEFIQGFLASNYAEVQSKWKLTFAKAVFYVPNNIHGKITQFWLAEKGVQFFCNTSANYVTPVQTCNTSANYKWFLIGWKHKRNHQEPIRLELFSENLRKWPWFSASNDLILYAKQQ